MPKLGKTGMILLTTHIVHDDSLVEKLRSAHDHLRCKYDNSNYYMANLVLRKFLCSDWFFLGQDFAVRTVSMETVQPMYFCFGGKPANLKFATKTAKKTVIIVILHSETTRRS